MEKDDIERLAKKIVDINNDDLFKYVIKQTNWELTEKDFKAGIYEMDIINALEELDDTVLHHIENIVKKYRIYTNVYINYGYSKVYAISREEACCTNPKSVTWNRNYMFLKSAPTRYVHEIRFGYGNTKRVTHCYSGNVEKENDEICVFIKEHFDISGKCNIEYAFILDGVIKNEKKFDVMF